MLPHPAYAGKLKPLLVLEERVAHRDEPEVHVLLLEVGERLGEVVDRGMAVALVYGVYELAADSGVVGADTLEVGHTFWSVLLDDFVVVQTLGRSTHRVADEAAEKAAVDLVSESVGRPFVESPQEFSEHGLKMRFREV